MCRWDEDQVGQFQFGEASVVQPIQFASVERAIAEVEPEELRRRLGLAVEHGALFTDVAVNHTEHDGHALITTQRQRLT